MSQEIEKQHLIEKYLQNELSSAEKAEFEKDIVQNKSLQEEILKQNSIKSSTSFEEFWEKNKSSID